MPLPSLPLGSSGSGTGAGWSRPWSRARRRRTPTAHPGCRRGGSARARARPRQAPRRARSRSRIGVVPAPRALAAEPRSAPAAPAGARSVTAGAVKHLDDAALALVQRAQLGRSGDAGLDLGAARGVDRAVRERREVGQFAGAQGAVVGMRGHLFRGVGASFSLTTPRHAESFPFGSVLRDVLRKGFGKARQRTPRACAWRRTAGRACAATPASARASATGNPLASRS